MFRLLARSGQAASLSFIVALACWAVTLLPGVSASPKSPSPALAVYFPYYRYEEGVEDRLYGTTHLILFSAKPREDGSVDFSRFKPEILEMARRAMEEHGLAATFCVGGWGRSTEFASAISTEGGRSRFIEDLLEFCLRHGLSGIDLDWEFPKGETQLADFSTFIAALSHRLHEKDLLLTAALGESHLLPVECYEHLDMVNLMSYQPWSIQSYEDWLEDAVKRALEGGVPPGKLVLGIPFFAKERGGERRAVSFKKIAAQGEAAFPESEHGYWPAGTEMGDLRLRLVDRYGLRGVMVWDFGHDSADPETSLLRHLSASLFAESGAIPDDGAGGGALADRNWPQWRGPLASGFAPHADPPVEWSESRNIRWKTALPGMGHSTPVIWGDRIFVTTAIPEGEELKNPRYSGRPGAHDNLPVRFHHRFVVVAVDRRDGKILWEKTVHRELPHEGGHETGSLASHSPAADGEHVFAFFGSRGLYCLDHEGNLQWQTDLGEMHTKHGHGEGSSAALFGDTLVVNWDHEGQSFVVAFDKETGVERWKVPRDELTSWATPIVVEHGGKAQVIVSATNRVRSYDLATGDVIWECGGMSANVVASPVAAGGLVIAGSSYDTRAMLAIRLEGAEGDITESGQVVWRRDQRTPYVPSPLLYEDTLYFLAHYQGILSCVDVKTGEDRAGPFRLDAIRNVYASPVGAAGRIYITDLDGATLVISHGEKPAPIALNRLDDSFSASAALAGREFFLRGARFLYCISDE